eukprot:scaffold239_cov382-Pavlova_lutheri.AAC.8
MAVGVRVEHGNVQQLRVCVPGWLIQGGNDRKGCRGEGKWGLEDWGVDGAARRACGSTKTTNFPSRVPGVPGHFQQGVPKHIASNPGPKPSSRPFDRVSFHTSLLHKDGIRLVRPIAEGLLRARNWSKTLLLPIQLTINKLPTGLGPVVNS